MTRFSVKSTFCGIIKDQTLYKNFSDIITMSESLPILIVGAGVAGPTLTLSLHQKGYKVILFEKYDAPSM